MPAARRPARFALPPTDPAAGPPPADVVTARRLIEAGVARLAAAGHVSAAEAARRQELDRAAAVAAFEAAVAAVVPAEFDADCHPDLIDPVYLDEVTFASATVTAAGLTVRVVFHYDPFTGGWADPAWFYPAGDSDCPIGDWKPAPAPGGLDVALAMAAEEAGVFA